MQFLPRTVRTRAAWVIAFGGCVLRGGTAMADEGAARAERLFREAAELVTRGQYEGACSRLEESQDLEPAVGTEFNLADCLEHVGKLASARQRFENVVSIAHQAGKFEREKVARARADALTARVGGVELSVARELDGLAIRVDGKSVASEERRLVRLDRGKHVVVASAPLHVAFRAEVDIEDGATTRLAIPALAPVPSAPTEPPGPPPTHPRRTLGLALAGVGVAGLATGGIFGAMALSLRGEAESECPAATYGFHCPTASGADAWNRASARGNVSTIAFVAGGVLLAAGAALWLTAPRSSTSPRAVIVPGAVFGAF